MGCSPVAVVIIHVHKYLVQVKCVLQKYSSNNACYTQYYNMKKCVFSEMPTCFKALTLLPPTSHMVATTSNTALWQASSN